MNHLSVRFLYNTYKWFYTFRHWRRRHFTPAGVIIISTIFLSGILGLNIFKTTLYQVLVFGFSLLFVSMVSGLIPFRLRVRVNRIFPDYATTGETVDYTIEIVNISSKTQKGLILYEEIQDPRPSLNTLLTKKEPFEHLRNVWDRKTMYYRWLWLIQRSAKARFLPVKLPDLPVGETICVPYSFIPRHRGYLHFSGFTFARPDVFGLFNRLFKVDIHNKLLVLPRRYQLENPGLTATRQYHPGGVCLASSIGDSDEFMSLRHYRPGDPLRSIHWRSFAKTNELVIKEFEDEYFVRHALILDTFLTSGNDAVFEEAVSIASSYIGSLRTDESILDLMFVGQHFYSFPSGRGLANSEKMLAVLACAEPSEDKTIFELVPALKSTIKKFSGSICIFLDWEDGHKQIHQLFQQASVPFFIIVLAENELKMAEKIRSATTDMTNIKVVKNGEALKLLGGG